MKKLLLTLAGITAAVLIFTGGIYASQWLSFTGGQQTQQTKENTNEMLDIIKEIAAGRDVAESDLKQVQDQANTLVNENEQLKNTNGQLTTELANVNGQLKNKQTEIDNKQAEINQKQQEINEKNQAYDALQQERDGLRSQIDNLNAQLETALNDSNASKEYIAHLEAELQKANAAVADVNEQSNAAVEEARTYK